MNILNYCEIEEGKKKRIGHFQWIHFRISIDIAQLGFYVWKKKKLFHRLTVDDPPGVGLINDVADFAVNGYNIETRSLFLTTTGGSPAQ